MFPYPSGYGLHVGHLLGYTGSDIVARVARKQGKAVLHPMGWDAFGLPAENFAIKSGVHPAISTEQNTLNFKRQFNQAGISYDWDREINSSKPEYYKWTQWLFELFYKRGLAYRKNGFVNWCPSCQTVLANEQVVAGACDRCGTTVIQKEMKQWYFKITDYADRLLEDLEELDWPEKIKAMQRNWIGKSTGAKLWFAVEGISEKIEVFTTRPDTLGGATFLVLAPEHPLVSRITTSGQKAAVTTYQETTAKASELERTFLDRDKTGVFTGGYAINPLTGEKVPVWIADYVLSTYGTGAIMAVPAHDERDFAFAQKFELPIVSVIETAGNPLPYGSRGVVTAPASVAGLENEVAVDKILELAGGEKTTIYRLRDWLISRQRFWGCPIPVIYDEEGNEQLLPEAALPIELPTDVEFRPTGQSPLQLAENWKYYTDPSGKKYTREVDTLDTFVCSSWYFLRYPTPHLETAAFDTELVNMWLPVDMYVGGAEHAVLHLLYSRFVTKVLFDEGLLNFKEPFKTLRNQGMILGPDHQKMSKSKGNVISPDEVEEKYGADTLRVYEMFMAPFESEKPWSETGIQGSRRFLDRIWKLQDKITANEPTKDELRSINQMVDKVANDIKDCKFNTCISAMMEALNTLSGLESIAKSTYTTLLTVLNPFAPHMTEELWEMLGMDGLCSLAPLPAVDMHYLIQEELEYAVQINGKVRAKISFPADLSDEKVLAAVKASSKVQEYIAGKQIIREIVVSGKLVSLVVAS